jgi:hypothetical protein
MDGNARVEWIESCRAKTSVIINFGKRVGLHFQFTLPLAEWVRGVERREVSSGVGSWPAGVPNFKRKPHGPRTALY